MTEELKNALSLLNSYLSDFTEKGYDADRAGGILSVLRTESGNTLLRVSSLFGCNDFETTVLVLCLLVSISGQAAKTASSLCPAPRGAVTPSLAGALFFSTEDIIPFLDSLQEYSPLDSLLDGVRPVYNAQLTIKGFVSDYLVNGSLFDEAFLPLEQSKIKLVPLSSQEQAINDIVSFIRSADRGEPFILRLAGDEGSGRHTCARAALNILGIAYMPVKINASMSDGRIKELCTKLILSGGIPVISTDDTIGRTANIVTRIAEETGLVILITGRSPSEIPKGSDTLTIRIGLPTLSEQLLLWRNYCGSVELSDEVDLSEISGEFEMSPGNIKRAVTFFSALAKDKKLTPADIKRGCYSSFDPDMGGKAVKLECRFSWKDIVLPEQSRRLLTDACSQVRMKHKVLDGWGFGEKLPYGKGVSMIFTGPPGTGKTMGAQVMAAELGMDIYKISLANVVSKYIGETEKNLNEIFDKAKLCQGILFFDEADVLFSKRTEVKDSNDKYSNMESAFLLQKTEEFSGVVILATNLVQNFDEAFKRRMRFIIDFPFPDASLRREIWKKAFPAKAPLDDIDFDFLVERFELSGSNIKNIALHSAFLAAGESTSGKASDGISSVGKIGMKHIMEALRNEYAKSGKAFTRAEAGEYYHELSAGSRGE